MITVTRTEDERVIRPLIDHSSGQTQDGSLQTTEGETILGTYTSTENSSPPNPDSSNYPWNRQAAHTEHSSSRTWSCRNAVTSSSSSHNPASYNPPNPRPDVMPDPWSRASGTTDIPPSANVGTYSSQTPTLTSRPYGDDSMRVNLGEPPGPGENYWQRNSPSRTDSNQMPIFSRDAPVFPTVHTHGPTPLSA